MEQNIKYVLDIGGQIIQETDAYTVKENRFGQNIVLKSYNIKPNSELDGITIPNSDQVFYVILGKGDIQLDQQMYEVQPGSVVTIPANVYHRIRNIGETDLYFLSVIGETFNRVRP